MATRGVWRVYLSHDKEERCDKTKYLKRLDEALVVARWSDHQNITREVSKSQRVLFITTHSCTAVDYKTSSQAPRHLVHPSPSTKFLH